MEIAEKQTKISLLQCKVGSLVTSNITVFKLRP
uniref:Uncharacterized protein n=1 Tax=Tetranychus urticae TaxID=32264 RepID=T1L4E4_TETUR